MQLPEIKRRRTRAVRVGSVTLGGGAPVAIQSMTNTRTSDAAATLAQIERLADAGADLVRLAVPTRRDTATLKEIVAAAPCPIIADVHFSFARALEAIDAGAAKIRLNPGNISDRHQVRSVIDAAARAGAAIRVGVNEGSIVERRAGRRRTAELARPLDELMVEKMAEYLQIFAEADFHNLVLSAKSHDALTCVAANRRLAEKWDYPLHLGVTHAGTAQTGAIRSAAAIGALLAEGIGETIRISYAGDPVAEVRAAVELLASLRLRKRRGVELIACPTCGRIELDIASIAEQVRCELAETTAPITVAIMGCVVNGPGEADSADVAICAGEGKAVLYRRGKKVRTVKTEKMVETVVAEVKDLARQIAP
ncbi:MAG: flavodoxin-dependent (E)-4-hydroxy-3-methylbut-2-enyl-diphosphate synthase [Planctomycetota bacterium]|jgi:(E)-4-hydroxy-3-methylbut-2-enyl-diphosphate synthase